MHKFLTLKGLNVYEKTNSNNDVCGGAAVGVCGGRADDE